MSKLSLEKGLDLAIVRSRSRLGRENERPVSSRYRENVGRSRSRSRLGLKNKRLGFAPQGLVYITASMHQ